MSQLIISIGIIILMISGCASNNGTSLKKKPSLLLKHKNGRTYYFPDTINLETQGGELKKDADAWSMNVISGNKISCKKHDIIIMTPNAKKTMTPLIQMYNKLLTPQENQIESKTMTVKKPNSKEFKKLVATGSLLAENGEMVCLHPLSNKQIEQLISKQM